MKEVGLEMNLREEDDLRPTKGRKSGRLRALADASRNHQGMCEKAGNSEIVKQPATVRSSNSNALPAYRGSETL